MTKQMFPCLWFPGNAGAAAEYYCAIFPNSKITSDSGMVVNFEINGFPVMGLNHGPDTQFSERVSFVLPCEDQKEIDHYWNSFVADGGEESMCGWCKDKFGLSWQVIPSNLGQLLSQPNKEQRVMQAFMKMKKIDIDALLNA